MSVLKPTTIALLLLSGSALAHEGMPLPVDNRLHAWADLRLRDGNDGEFAVPGFMLNGGPAANGLALAGSGIALQVAVPEQGLSAWLEAGLHGDHVHGGGEGLELEQAWVARRDGDWTLVAGRQFVTLGLRNASHGPAADFPEPSLAWRVFADGNLRDDGVALRHGGDGVVLGAGLWQGAFPAGGAGSDGQEAASLHLDGHASLAGGRLLWRLSGLAARAALREDARYADGHSHDPFTPALPRTWFSGDSWLGTAGVQWTADDGDLALLGEVFARREKGSVRSLTQLADYEGTQSGVHAEVLWSPVARWRLGLRQAALAADNSLAGAGAATLATLTGLQTAGNPLETTLLVERRLDGNQLLRLQWTTTDQVIAGDSLLLQYAWQWQTPL